MTLNPELIIFAKTPYPGNVKTRIAEKTSEEFAALISELLLKITLDNAVSGWDGPISLCVTPDTDFPLFTEYKKKFGLNVYKQVDNQDLGIRMYQALKSSYLKGHGAAIVGADIPFCNTEIFAQTNILLRNEKSVIGPTNDGGYYLIGLIYPYQQLFENIWWSTPVVFKQTMDVAEKSDINFSILPQLRDIDTWDDLKYAAELIPEINIYFNEKNI